jgi:hypothetical protein
MVDAFLLCEQAGSGPTIDLRLMGLGSCLNSVSIVTAATNLPLMCHANPLHVPSHSILAFKGKEMEVQSLLTWVVGCRSQAES